MSVENRFIIKNGQYHLKGHLVLNSLIKHCPSQQDKLEQYDDLLGQGWFDIDTCLEMISGIFQSEDVKLTEKLKVINQITNYFQTLSTSGELEAAL